MLTTVPFDTFMSLENGTLNETRKRFNINTFKTLPIEEMRSYLIDQCGIPLGGKGTSREAYFLDKSDFNMAKGPSCLKLARTKGGVGVYAGIGQNREETNILKRFQHSHDCFPILYSWDSKNYFLIVELGTPLSKAPKSFVSTQFEPIKETIEDFLDRKSVV